MTEGCPARLTGEFLRYVWSYPEARPAILQRLAQLEDKRVIHLRGDHEAAQFPDVVRRFIEF